MTIPLRALTGLSCCLVAALAACAVKQPPAPADASSGVLPSTTPVPSGWTASGAAPGPVVTGAAATESVATFGDPQLESLVEEGLRNNLDLAAAVAGLDAASALVVQARSLLYPLQLQARQLDARFDLIGVRNDRLANRVALHLALGGGFAPPPAP